MGGRKINKSSINYVTWAAWVNWLKCFFVCLVHNSDRIQENIPSSVARMRRGVRNVWKCNFSIEYSPLQKIGLEAPSYELLLREIERSQQSEEAC